MKHLPLLLVLLLSAAAQTSISPSQLGPQDSGGLVKEPPVVPCSDSSQKAVTIVTGALSQMGITSAALDSHFVLTVTDARGAARSIDIRQLNKNLRIAAGTGAIVSKAHAASIQKATNRKRLPIWIAESAKPEHFPASYVASALSDSTCKMQFLGEESLNSGAAQRVRIWVEPDDGSEPRISKLLTQADFWFDSTSQQIVRARTYIFSPEIIENRSPVDVYYSDFRTIGSTKVPFKAVRFIEGTKYQDVVVTSVALGAGNTDADFAAADGGVQ